MKKSFIAASLALAAVAARRRWPPRRRTSPSSTASRCRRRASTRSSARSRSRPRSAASRCRPTSRSMVRDKVVTDEILRQEAERRGLGRLGRLQVADGARAPEHPDRPAARRTSTRRPPSPTPTIQSRIRQVQGAGHRHRVQGAPHPGREGRRGQGDRSPSSRPARSSRTSPRRTRRTRARRRTAATSTSPRPARTCPSSRRR